MVAIALSLGLGIAGRGGGGGLALLVAVAHVLEELAGAVSRLAHEPPSLHVGTAALALPLAPIDDDVGAAAAGFVQFLDRGHALSISISISIVLLVLILVFGISREIAASSTIVGDA